MRIKKVAILRPFSAAWWIVWVRRAEAGLPTALMSSHALRGKGWTVPITEAPSSLERALLFVPIETESGQFWLWSSYFEMTKRAKLPKPSFVNVIWMPSQTPPSVLMGSARLMEELRERAREGEEAALEALISMLPREANFHVVARERARVIRSIDARLLMVFPGQHGVSGRATRIEKLAKEHEQGRSLRRLEEFAVVPDDDLDWIKIQLAQVENWEPATTSRSTWPTHGSIRRILRGR